jgi:plastocyanin
MRWFLAVFMVTLVALGASALVMTQNAGSQGSGSPTPCASPSASPMAGTPTTYASPTAMASPSASPTGCEAMPATGGQTITMVDIAFQPKTLTIPANTDVMITLNNTGVTKHNFSIDQLGISVDVEPGQTGSVTINAPAGTYQFYCNVPGHKEAGMVGTLTVQ